MKYQLVLQWPATSIADYDDMIDIEDTLVNRLSAPHDVDGHDAGPGEMNIFILTDNPAEAFAEVESILGSRDFWVDARVAYREVGANKYVVFWPRDADKFSVR
jgi:hypothetical protein